jgi:hypothetical protein
MRPLDERVINGLLDNDAVNNDADLALVQKLAEHCGLKGLIQIGVREHNSRSTRLMIGAFAASSPMLRPTGVEPVNETTHGTG